MGKRGDEGIQRILLGIGLAVLALFLFLSLIPIAWLGHGPGGLFPSGNIVGPFGALVSEALLDSFGATAALVPAFAGLGSLWSFGLVGNRRSIRGLVFVAGALFITPGLIGSVAIPLSGAGTTVAGGYGLWMADWLALGIGWLGAALVLAALLATLFVGTLGLEPFKAARSLLIRTGHSARIASAYAVDWFHRAHEAAAQVWHQLEARLTRGPRPTALAGVSGDEPSRGAGRAGNGGRPEGDGDAKERKRKKRSGLAKFFPDSGDPDAVDLPPIDLLSPAPKQQYSVNEAELDELGDVLIEKLRTFRVEGEIGGRTTGPVVTQFEVVPASGVKVGKIASLADDLALALKAASIRIIAPIPGKGAVGVEVPNPERKTVYLREILESRAFEGSRAELPLALGEDVTGGPYVADLTKMPHLLIAGVTGSGKSVCINSIITSLIYRYTPERLRLLLVDPKMVELAGYNVLPHLRHPVVTDNSDAATVLKWLVYEMEIRYGILSANRCRNISEYNRRIDRAAPVREPGADGEVIEDPEKLPYIVLVIDELADLMMTVQAEVERPLAFLAQKARATGIHLVVATQRPSVNVITGLIKANFPCRIAFRVASKVDSRTIIDQNGADTLLGNGDMLFLPPGTSEPVRLQGTFIATEDTEHLMDWYRARAEEREAAERSEEEDILESVRLREMEEAEKAATVAVLEDVDPLFRQAAEVIIQHDQGSTSLLQRRLKVGYGRAARIVDQLHDAGIVGPPEGSKPREVLVTLEELEHIVANLS